MSGYFATPLTMETLPEMGFFYRLLTHRLFF